MKRASPAAAAQTPPFVEPTSVTVHRRPARVEHGPHLGRKRGHRRRHDGQLGIHESGDEVGRRLDGASLRRRREMGRVRIPAGHALDPGAPRPERDGRADQARADDGERSEPGPYA